MGRATLTVGTPIFKSTHPKWSGQTASNRRHLVWKTNALPTELCPQICEARAPPVWARPHSKLLINISPRAGSSAITAVVKVKLLPAEKEKGPDSCGIRASGFRDFRECD
jgi:hypothetical protein